jgi:hypothetical protein
MKLKPISYYNKNKIFFNEHYNKEWKQIAGPPYIGYTSYLFQQFFEEWNNSNEREPTVNDFAEYYVSHTNPIKSYEVRREDSKYYGRSENELLLLAMHYQKKCNNYDVPLEKYYDDVICHTIVETFFGQIWEAKLILEYKKRGFTIEQKSGKWDNHYGVDIIVKSGNEIKDYVQCKPVTTFLGRFNESLIEDRKNFYKKEKQKKEECLRCGLPYFPTKFVLYDKKRESWCSLPGRRGLYIEDLTDTNGIPLHEYSDFVRV